MSQALINSVEIGKGTAKPLKCIWIESSSLVNGFLYSFSAQSKLCDVCSTLALFREALPCLEMYGWGCRYKQLWANTLTQVNKSLHRDSMKSSMSSFFIPTHVYKFIWTHTISLKSRLSWLRPLGKSLIYSFINTYTNIL